LPEHALSQQTLPGAQCIDVQSASIAHVAPFGRPAAALPARAINEVPTATAIAVRIDILRDYITERAAAGLGFLSNAPAARRVAGLVRVPAVHTADDVLRLGERELRA
jgi:hypothetical protein